MKRVVVNFEGRSRFAVLGRANVGRRPLVLVETEETSHPISVILQNAKTIRPVQTGERAILLIGLEEGSEALVCTEKGGRHFRVRMDENIIDR